MASVLRNLVVKPRAPHQSTVIFLHGLGDTGRGWAPVADLLGESLPNTKWVLPHAPQIPITRHRGEVLPAWFDVYALANLSNSKQDDESGILSTVAAVDLLIQAEVDAGIPENKIILGGFSQGGAISALSGLIGGRRLGGVVVLSSWLPLSHKVQEMVKSTARDIPYFWGHGKDDNIVSYTNGQRSVELLTKIGFPPVSAAQVFARPGLRFESYGGLGHSASPEELDDLMGWLKLALE